MSAGITTTPRPSLEHAGRSITTVDAPGHARLLGRGGAACFRSRLRVLVVAQRRRRATPRPWRLPSGAPSPPCSANKMDLPPDGDTSCDARGGFVSLRAHLAADGKASLVDADGLCAGIHAPTLHGRQPPQLTRRPLDEYLETGTFALRHDRAARGRTACLPVLFGSRSRTRASLEPPDALVAPGPAAQLARRVCRTRVPREPRVARRASLLA